VISRQAIADYHARQFDSCTWLKKLSREQILDELKTFKVKPVFKGHDRWTHQLVCFLIGMSYPEYLFLLDMGLGKTAICLDIMTQKVREKQITKSLVMVPRMVNLASWEKDITAHSEFEPNLCSGDIEEKWERLLNPRGEVSVIDYHGLQLALTKKETSKGKKSRLVRDDSKVAKLYKVYDNFILDESHKAKNKDTLRFMLLRALLKQAKSVYGSTGTLFGRNPEDIFAQFYLVDNGETFGDTLGMFRAAFFDESRNNWGALEYKFRKELTRDLYRMLQHRSIRYSDFEVPEVEIPKCHQIKLPLKFSDEQREHYLRAVEGLINARGKLSEIDSAFIRMRQITSGYLEWNDEHGKHTVEFPENPKMQALENILDESGDAKVIVSCEFTQTGRMITTWLEKNGYGYEWLYGGTKDAGKCLNSFLTNPAKKVFVMNSESGGTGTDGLQHVSHIMYIYESPVSPITRTQLVKRVNRSGQAHRSYIYDPIIEKSIDLRILSFIEEGKSLYDSIVNGKLTRNDLIS
jgi:SNF2 family DNA or RNA helicase